MTKDNRTVDQVIDEAKKITMDDVYKTVGKWVIWGAIARGVLRAVSK